MLYKVLAVILSVYWITFGLTIIYGYVIRTHVYPITYKQIVYEYADTNGLDRALIFAVIKVESDFDKNAVSPAGAEGLMQITPKTADYIAKMLKENKYDLKDENTNVRYGCYYIKYLTKRFIDVQTAICAYNAGEGNVSAWLKNPEYSSDGLTLKEVPFPETREYVKKINQTFTKYKNLYGNILDKR